MSKTRQTFNSPLTYLREAGGLAVEFKIVDVGSVDWFWGGKPLDCLSEPQRLRNPASGFTHILKRLSGQPIGLTAENIRVFEKVESDINKAYLASPQYEADCRI